MKEETFDWFGMNKKKSKSNSPFNILVNPRKSKPSGSNPFTFMVNPKSRRVAPVSLFPGLNLKPRKSEPASFIRPVKMGPTIFNNFNRSRSRNIRSSEELLYGKRNLRLFGDRDMDGSPNKFDCNPWRSDRDGPVKWIKGALAKRKKKDAPADIYGRKRITEPMSMETRKKRAKQWRETAQPRRYLKPESELGLEPGYGDITKERRQLTHATEAGKVRREAEELRPTYKKVAGISLPEERAKQIYEGYKSKRVKEFEKTRGEELGKARGEYKQGVAKVESAIELARIAEEKKLDKELTEQKKKTREDIKKYKELEGKLKARYKQEKEEIATFEEKSSEALKNLKEDYTQNISQVNEAIEKKKKWAKGTKGKERKELLDAIDKDKNRMNKLKETYQQERKDIEKKTEEKRAKKEDNLKELETTYEKEKKALAESTKKKRGEFKILEEEYGTKVKELKLSKEEEKIKKQQEIREAFAKQEKEISGKKAPMALIEAGAAKELGEKEAAYFPKEEKKLLEKGIKEEEKIRKAEQRREAVEQFEEGGRFYGELGKIRMIESDIAEKAAAGKAPTLAALSKLAKAKKGYEETHVVAALKAGKLPTGKAIKALVKTAERGELLWSPEAAQAATKTARMTAGILGAFLPPGTVTGRKYSSGGQVGRPRGSYKNYIPGVGNVDIYTYRKWARQQLAIQRMGGQLPEQSPEYQIQQQILQQQAEQLAPATAGLNEQGNYDYSQYEAPKVYDLSNLPPDQAKDIQTKNQAYQRALLNQKYDQVRGREMRMQDQTLPQVRLAQGRPPILPQQQVQVFAPPLSVKTTQPIFKDMMQVAQYNAQVADNVLHAPSFQKGELVGTGTNLFTYTPPEGNILNAPNITLGQMRNVSGRGEVPAVRLSPKPIPNPEGEQYTEIDPVSGRAILRSRKEEKWMTGEAY